MGILHTKQLRFTAGLRKFDNDSNQTPYFCFLSGFFVRHYEGRKYTSLYILSKVKNTQLGKVACTIRKKAIYQPLLRQLIPWL